MTTQRLLWIAAWISLLLTACPTALAARPVPPGDCEAVLVAAERAKGFLESLAPQIDPVRLRQAHQMKGKKFYVEYLNGWWTLYQVSDAAEQKAIRDFLAPIVERTRTSAYHNLETVSDREFRQDIISYLSACVLHQQFGFDTSAYREHIRRILPRTLSAEHLRARGIDNTMAIVYRLRQLGHDARIGFCALWRRPGCVSREHPDLTALDLSHWQNWRRVYDLTHEIFYLTEFGATPMQCVSGDDLAYIRRAHAALIPIFIGHMNIDAVAELVMDLNFLRMTDLPEYAVGRQFILRHQNEDGSWGDPKHIARLVEEHFASWNPAYLPKVGQHLHTTQVALNALLCPCRPSAQATSRSATAPTTLPGPIRDNRQP